MIFLPKPSTSQHEIKNYPPISLLDIHGKLLDKILTYRLTDHLLLRLIVATLRYILTVIRLPLLDLISTTTTTFNEQPTCNLHLRRYSGPQPQQQHVYDRAQPATDSAPHHLSLKLRRRR
ncbi:hypothetical protein FHG87_024328 [Trinorchestia longiramus]|nr:hypothetical protein FHG87_024328 [Trinorchestia longiramus]